MAILDGDKVLVESARYFGTWAAEGSASEFARGDGRSTQVLYAAVLLDERVNDPAFVDRLILRVTPDPEAAFRDLLSPAYWTGKMEFRVHELPMRL